MIINKGELTVRVIVISFIVILNLILQSTVFQWVKIYGVLPNTALILVISFAIHNGKNKGATIGFFVGILQDIVFGRIIGINALIFMIIGYLIGLMDQKIFKENLAIPFILTAIASLLYETTNLLLIFLLGYRIELINVMKKMLIVGVIYNSILSPIIYYYVSKLLKSSLMRKSH